MTEYDGRVRVKKQVPALGQFEPGPRKYMAYRVEVISPASRRGEVFDLALGPGEDEYRPDYDRGDEFNVVLPPRR
jgi:hypothetical protein